MSTMFNKAAQSLCRLNHAVTTHLRIRLQTDEANLRYGAGAPVSGTTLIKPFIDKFVVRVKPICQSEQHVHIK